MRARDCGWQSLTERKDGAPTLPAPRYVMQIAESWSRYRHAVPGHDLLLVGEHFPAAWVDQPLQPVHVVGPILLVVAERLDTREIFQTP